MEEIRLNIGSFWENSSNVESDIKSINWNIENNRGKKVFRTFVECGAPSEIMYSYKPHIGTDNLINIVSNIRNYIIEQGGEFLFNEKVTDFEFTNNKISAIYCSKKIETDSVILAIGHSSRDTFEKLYEKGVNMEQKDFSVGVRIEHKQDMINISQYGEIIWLLVTMC